MTTTDAPKPGTRRSALDRATAMRLAADEYARYLDQLRALEPADWTQPTDCPAWAVRAMATHNLGMAEMVTSMREYVRQNAGAARRGGVFIDALTALQVRERRDLDPRADRRALRRRRRAGRPRPPRTCPPPTMRPGPGCSPRPTARKCTTSAPRDGRPAGPTCAGAGSRPLLSTHGLPVGAGLDGLAEPAAAFPTGEAFVPPGQEFVDGMLAMAGH